MEDALRDTSSSSSPTNANSLNPCSNGRCSARGNIRRGEPDHRSVLILVLMEDALRVNIELVSKLAEKRLNPCSNGRCSAGVH